MLLSLLISAGCAQRDGSRATASRPADSAHQQGAVATHATIPAVPLHTALQQASVGEALRTHNHPERLMLIAAPTPFDSIAYRQHPERYLDVIEPGRALAPARPGPGVPWLRTVGDTHPVVQALGTLALAAQVTSRAPVTFTSLDRGAFENDLTSITVQADAAGLATVHLTATAGTVAEVRILAASPMASGRGRWVVSIAESPHEPTSAVHSVMPAVSAADPSSSPYVSPASAAASDHR